LGFILALMEKFTVIQNTVKYTLYKNFTKFRNSEQSIIIKKVSCDFEIFCIYKIDKMRNFSKILNKNCVKYYLAISFFDNWIPKIYNFEYFVQFSNNSLIVYYDKKRYIRINFIIIINTWYNIKNLIKYLI